MTKLVVEIIAAAAGFFGALLLIWWPSPLTLMVTKEGHGIINWLNSPPPEQIETNKALWHRHMRRYRFGLGLLAFGFALQLVSLFL
jgi:hypothetical protein